MLDLSLGKLFVIGLIALFLVGPDKLPQYAAQLGRWVRIVRGLADGAKERLVSELGPEFDDVDWAGLDPRRYNPRRLLIDAWNAPGEATAVVGLQHDDDGRRSDPDRANAPDLLELAESRAIAESVAVRPVG